MTLKSGGTTIFLGIDTGGTYTDAVLFDKKRGVVATAKAPTTRHRLSIGIEAAVRAVLIVPASEIELVSLSSTLATNAIVEGQGSPICLLLIGYEPRLV
ncbi:MAG: hydantoinase/oxoprolinase N-terminal domain-containing protein, partial [Dehalococcoidia bacterium]|nr:hydantoinase/oxoprolinase N-terminal domain-containing protein [Dehalococcoidia bacterium]